MAASVRLAASVRHDHVRHHQCDPQWPLPPPSPRLRIQVARRVLNLGCMENTGRADLQNCPPPHPIALHSDHHGDRKAENYDVVCCLRIAPHIILTYTASIRTDPATPMDVPAARAGGHAPTRPCAGQCQARGEGAASAPEGPTLNLPTSTTAPPFVCTSLTGSLPGPRWSSPAGLPGHCRRRPSP